MKKLRWGLIAYRGNKKEGYKYTYRVYYDKDTYRDITVKLDKYWKEIDPILYKNWTKTNLLFEGAMKKAGYKTEMSESTFINLNFDNCSYITENLLYLE